MKSSPKRNLSYGQMKIHGSSKPRVRVLIHYEGESLSAYAPNPDPGCMEAALVRKARQYVGECP